jgi:heat shock protein HslJ
MRFPLEVNAMRFAVLAFLVLFATVLAHAQQGRVLSTDQRVLTGIEWRLVSLGPTGAEQDVIPGTTVTLRLGEDGRAGGSTGCNTYGGSYQVRGDSISFNRIVATRRACLDQNANEQEHRFLAALESASRFRLTSNRLTILSDRARSILNFVNNSAPDPPDSDARPPRDDRRDPIEMLASYYEAINAKDYRRAYRLWESPESSYERFVAGFADTDRVRLLVEPSGRNEGAAGSVYAEFTTVVVATTRAGSERVLAGCYTLRRSNVRDSGWRIYRADISTMPAGARVSRMLSQVCRNSQ